MTATSTDKPPYPRRIHFASRWRANLAGRRTARAGIVPDDSAHLPFTHQLATRAHAGQMNVGHWLHVRVEGLDRQIAAAAAAYANARRAVTDSDTQAAHADTRAANTTDPAEAIRATRAATRYRDARDSEQARADRIAAQLAELVNARRHTLDRARTAGQAWAVRYNALAASHHAGYLTRRRRTLPSMQVWQVPILPPAAVWMHADLPFLVPAADPHVQQVLSYVLSEFNRAEPVAVR